MSVLDRLDHRALRAVVTSFRDAVRAHAPALNLLNVYPVPDGDTGTNMARTLDAVVAEMERAADDLDATCEAISHGSLMGARGNSGVILSQILRGIATTLRSVADDPADVERAGGDGRRIADALLAASAGAYQAVLTPVEGTILTVVRESAQAADAAATAGAALVEVLEQARRAGRDSLARTPDLLPVLRDAGVVDAGGAGFVLLLDAALHVVSGRPLPEPDVAPVVAADAEVVAGGEHHDEPFASPAGSIDVAAQRYEVMYLCTLDDARIDEFKRGWGRIGDSIVVVGGDGLWNCHVHTNDIGAAIEVALDLGGRPSRIRVTDLFEEVAEEHAHREALLHVATSPSSVHRCGVVAVASGDGIAALFRELGVDQVVEGGQTANPSTAELVDAVHRCGTPEVIVLPNNRNIVPVAQQVDGLTGVAVVVVPTHTMVEGLAALVAFDADADGPTNGSNMVESARGLATGEVTRAVRDSASAVGPIRQGDWIGLVRGDGIVAVADSAVAASMMLLERLLVDGGEIVTVLTGDDAEPDATDRLVDWLDAEHADVEVEVHRGGQPLYPYLFGVE